MKNLLLFLSLTINLLVFFIACSKNETSGTQNASGSPNDGHVVRRAGGNNGNDPNATFRSAPPSMPYNMVAQMIGNYRSRQLSAINSALGINDAYAACFNLDSIENYIYHLRSQVLASGCSSLSTLGIRFYYGAYSTPAEGGMPYSYSRKHTLIMIPAYLNDDGYYVDFDPMYIDSESCTPAPLGRNGSLSSTQNGTPLTTMMSTGQTYAMDHPMLSPPPVQGMAF